LAAEIEGKLGESSALIQGSGGIFEVEHNGQLIFSKKAVSRFPEDCEVIEIVKLLEAGVSIEEAQAKASANIEKPPSFFQWFTKRFLDR
jgi:selT/selW/selH-like putative selenoprotein